MSDISDSLRCNKCGDEYEVDSYSNEFLETLIECLKPGCDGRYSYVRWQERSDPHYVWVSEEGCYVREDLIDKHPPTRSQARLPQ